MDLVHSILYAILGGIIPSLIWLSFWLREDRAHPEPKKRILETFLGGAACTFFILPLAWIASHFINLDSSSVPAFFVLAVFEEILKFIACYYIALRSRDDDEPIDSVIYMIVAALGFSACENFLYLLDPHFNNSVIGLFANGNLRFIGASLLHILTSSIVGIFIAYSFYKPRIHKSINTIIGLFLASILHTLFNVFVIGRNDGSSVILTFTFVWFAVILLIIIFEKVKIIKDPTLPEFRG